MEDAPEADSEECSSMSKSCSSHHRGGPPQEYEARCAREWGPWKNHDGRERRTNQKRKTKTWRSKEETRAMRRGEDGIKCHVYLIQLDRLPRACSEQKYGNVTSAGLIMACCRHREVEEACREKKKKK